MQIKNLSPNRPKDLILDLPEEDAKELIETGEFEALLKEKLVLKKKSDKEIEKE